jgi:hypothetical protein
MKWRIKVDMYQLPGTTDRRLRGRRLTGHHVMPIYREPL